ncbi:hypothetical protein HHK36_025603 [Tetracentron sinense]|uniref:Uncharacterized protein n=1 Tax=Tetracentron sinense TaxID=13715 RepID=A0A835D3Q5_TETSI|nr:hypothetical protein HHK36_025603 [Tetracentron sinense]
MEKSHPLPWLNLMVSEPFYLFHFLAFFSYFVVRTSATQILSPDVSDRLLRREIQAILAFSVLAVIKMVKEETWEAFIADTLFFAKVVTSLSLLHGFPYCSCFIHGLPLGSVLPGGILRYSNKNISFGIVDLGLFPNAAEKFGISMGVSMGQLPTYILFDNGVEVARSPELDFDAKASRPPITKSRLCRHFELDRHLLEYVCGK